jgi:hypothetical protein
MGDSKRNDLRVIPTQDEQPPRRRNRTTSLGYSSRIKSKSRMSQHALSVTDTLIISKHKAVSEMHPFTLRFKDDKKEVYYAKHVEKMQNSDVKKTSSKVLCLLAVAWIVMYDASGAAGNNSDSDTMKDYYVTRTKWNAGVAAVMIAIFLAAHQIVARQGLLWRLVSCVGGPVLFFFKEGSNIMTQGDRYWQLRNAPESGSGTWTGNALPLAEDYYMQAYFLQSLVGSVVVLLLFHLVFKFDMLSMCASTATMCVMSIVLARLMEQELETESAHTGNTMTILSLFTTLCCFTFCAYSFLTEYHQRVEWLMTQDHIDNLYNVKKKEAGAAIEVGTGMESVISTLVDLFKKTNEPQLEMVINRLNSGENLWEADASSMAALPTWLQEQDTAYMRKKEQDVFFQKHTSPRKKRVDMKLMQGSIHIPQWSVGNKVVISKMGSKFGESAIVEELDWKGTGRVLVSIPRDDGAAMRSYLPIELKRDTGQSLLPRPTNAKVFGDHILTPLPATTLNPPFIPSDKLSGPAPASAPPSQQGPISNTLVTDELLVGVEDFAFDIFALQRLLIEKGIAATGNSNSKRVEVLSLVGSHLFARIGVETNLGVSSERAMAFLRSIEASYNACPYHNAMHGADVMANMHYFFVASDLGTHLTPLEKFAGLFAGAVHDVQHPGVNTQFLVNTEDPLAITYNDMSPLENMHCATAFRAAKETRVLEQLDNGDKRMMRKQVVAMVLATDMAQHFSFVAKFKAKLGKWGTAAHVAMANTAEAAVPSSPDRIRSLTLVSPKNTNGAGLSVMVKPLSLMQTAMEAGAEDRLEVMCMCAKNSDIANAAKPFDLHEQWSKRVLQEFFAQGEAEEQRGMPISTLCNREEIDIFKSQIGFIDFIAMPLFKVWCDFLKSQRVSQDMGVGVQLSVGAKGVMGNRQRWSNQQEQNNSQVPYKDRQLLRSILFEQPAEQEWLGMLECSPKRGSKLSKSSVPSSFLFPSSTRVSPLIYTLPPGSLEVPGAGSTPIQSPAPS